MFFEWFFSIWENIFAFIYIYFLKWKCRIVDEFLRDTLNCCRRLAYILFNRSIYAIFWRIFGNSEILFVLLLKTSLNSLKKFNTKTVITQETNNVRFLFPR